MAEDEGAGVDENWLSWPDEDAPSDAEVPAEPDADGASSTEAYAASESARQLAEAIERAESTGVPFDESALLAAGEATDEPSGDTDQPAWMRKPQSASVADDADEVPGLNLPVPSSSLSAGRIDNVPAAIGALSMRIDSLIAATTTYRSVMSDRLAEYAELVSRLNRTQATDLEDFRKANERTVGEIRRTIGATEEALRAVSGQSEQLVTDVGALSEHVRTNTADGRELLEAVDKLGRFVTEALDQFAERVLGEMRKLGDSVTPELGSMRSELTLTRESIDELNERTSPGPIRESIDELRGDLSGLRRAVLEWPDLEVTRSEIMALRADMSSLLEASGLSGDDERGLLERTAEDVSALRADLEQMRGDGEDSAAQQMLQQALDQIAELRSELSSIVEDDDGAELARFVKDLGSLRESIGQLPERAELVAELGDLRSGLEQIREQIGGSLDLGAVVDELERLDARMMALPDVDRIRSEVVAAAIDAAAAANTPEALAGDLADLRTDLSDLRSVLGDLTQLEVPAASGPDLSELRDLIEEKLDAISLPEPPPPVDPSEAIEAVTAEVAALRHSVTDLAEWASQVAERSAGAPAAATPDGAVISDEAIESLRDEVKALRRRIKVRAQDDAPRLSDEQMQALIEGVVEALRDLA